MPKTLAEMRTLEKKAARDSRYYKRRKQVTLHCENCDYPMPHIIAIEIGGYKDGGIRWECMGCGQIHVEEKGGDAC